MKTRLLIPIVSFLTAATMPAAEPDKSYVAHEWGTFTSVQAADGVQLIWNPQVTSELPSFVYEAHRVFQKTHGYPVLSKNMIYSRQRLETPVIYFYSNRARTVDVEVKFPNGQVTEWFPQESAADLMVTVYPPHPSHLWPALSWKGVHILSPVDPSPQLPIEPGGSHYYAARETDAAFLSVPAEGPKDLPAFQRKEVPAFPVADASLLLPAISSVGLSSAVQKTAVALSGVPAASSKIENEKFLFYRGIGDFQTPLSVRLVGDHAADVALENKGTEALRSLFVYEVRADGDLSWISLSDLQPGETRVTAIAGHSSDAAALTAALRTALVREGLYEKEAAAMVKTWESSWLKERGWRVLYTLPRAWTNNTLPLTITPAPTAIERVMVGRAEIITPAMEQALQAQVERYMQAPAEQRPAVIAETHALGFGRFLEAVWSQIQLHHPLETERNKKGWELAQAVTALEKKPAGTTGSQPHGS